jgi:hypothetical protein
MPTQHSINLAWNASTPGSDPAVGYNVYRGGVTGGPYTKLNAALVTVTTFSDASGAGGATYFYVIEAVDAQGNASIYSNEASATMLQNPNAPSGLTASAV